MKRNLLAFTILLFLLASSSEWAVAQEWQAQGALNLTNHLSRNGRVNVGAHSSPSGWPAQFQVINWAPSSQSNNPRIDFLISRVAPGLIDGNTVLEPFLKIDEYTDLTYTGQGGLSSPSTKMIFTADRKFGINTGSPAEMLTVNKGNVLVDLDNVSDAKGIVIKGNQIPLVTAARTGYPTTFTSGPFEGAGMLGMLMHDGSLTFSIKREPGNYRYKKFKFVGSNFNGDMQEFMTINENGIVGINCGETSPGANDNINLHWATGYKLHVRGGIRADRIKVDIDYNSWPDYVFEEDYELRSLQDVASFVKENKHLPDVPSAKELSEKGASLAEIDAVLLQKIEELTLYIIQQQEEIEALKNNQIQK